MGRIDAGREHDGRDSNKAAAEGVDGHLEASHWDAGASGSLFAAANGVRVTPQLRLAKNERSNESHNGQDDDWHWNARDLATSEKIEFLGESVHGEAIAK